jgi:hypothetical protein
MDEAKAEAVVADNSKLHGKEVDSSSQPLLL